MDGPRNYINELSQTVKDKHHITYIRNLKKDTNELICKKVRFNDFEKKLMVIKMGRLGGDEGLGIWDWHMHSEVYGMIGQLGPGA